MPYLFKKKQFPWASKLPGVSHTCGHDGHMTMLLALGRIISRNPIKCGKVVLMFQPSEEMVREQERLYLTRGINN